MVATEEMDLIVGSYSARGIREWERVTSRKTGYFWGESRGWNF